MKESTRLIEMGYESLHGYIMSKKKKTMKTRDVQAWSDSFQVAKTRIVTFESLAETSTAKELVRKMWNLLYNTDFEVKNFINTYGEVVRR